MGYIKYDNGIIEQWGEVTITPTTANTPRGQAINFPVPFINVPENINVTPNTAVPGSTVTGWSFAVPSATGMTLYITRTNTTATTLHWRALGHWK